MKMTSLASGQRHKSQIMSLNRPSEFKYLSHFHRNADLRLAAFYSIRSAHEEGPGST